uniref:Uncharacterized protein n=1 Tax=Pseudo-nitzschia multistriata TaxID=183589 RepID=A0A448ZLI2_9STRA
MPSTVRHTKNSFFQLVQGIDRFVHDQGVLGLLPDSNDSRIHRRGRSGLGSGSSSISGSRGGLLLRPGNTMLVPGPPFSEGAVLPDLLRLGRARRFGDGLHAQSGPGLVGSAQRGRRRMRSRLLWMMLVVLAVAAAGALHRIEGIRAGRGKKLRNSLDVMLLLFVLVQKNAVVRVDPGPLRGRGSAVPDQPRVCHGLSGRGALLRIHGEQPFAKGNRRGFDALPVVIGIAGRVFLGLHENVDRLLLVPALVGQGLG